MLTQIQSIIDCNKVLPQSYIIPESGQHLYKIGLTHFRVGNSDKESKQHLYYRFFVIIIYVIFFIHSLIALSVPNNIYKDVHLYNGDWTYNQTDHLSHNSRESHASRGLTHASRIGCLREVRVSRI